MLRSGLSWWYAQIKLYSPVLLWGMWFEYTSKESSRFIFINPKWLSNSCEVPSSDHSASSLSSSSCSAGMESQFNVNHKVFWTISTSQVMFVPSAFYARVFNLIRFNRFSRSKIGIPSSRSPLLNFSWNYNYENCGFFANLITDFMSYATTLFYRMIR